MEELKKELRCRVHIFKKDCPRYTGRRGGFEMHYTEQQCKRKSVENNRCKQHQSLRYPIYPNDLFFEFWEREEVK